MGVTNDTILSLGGETLTLSHSSPLKGTHAYCRSNHDGSGRKDAGSQVCGKRVVEALGLSERNALQSNTTLSCVAVVSTVVKHDMAV